MGQGFLVMVDYAHTPDSVENVLRAARSLTQGRLIVVLGAGGDRDRAKRPLMGRAATANADLAIVTSDNPRSEDPLAIIAEITPGAEHGRGRPLRRRARPARGDPARHGRGVARRRRRDRRQGPRDLPGARGPDDPVRRPRGRRGRAAIDREGDAPARDGPVIERRALPDRVRRARIAPRTGRRRVVRGDGLPRGRAGRPVRRDPKGSARTVTRSCRTRCARGAVAALVHRPGIRRDRDRGPATRPVRCSTSRPTNATA